MDFKETMILLERINMLEKKIEQMNERKIETDKYISILEEKINFLYEKTNNKKENIIQSIGNVVDLIGNKIEKEKEKEKDLNKEENIINKNSINIGNLFQSVGNVVDTIGNQIEKHKKIERELDKEEGNLNIKQIKNIGEAEKVFLNFYRELMHKRYWDSDYLHPDLRFPKYKTNNPFYREEQLIADRKLYEYAEKIFNKKENL